MPTIPLREGLAFPRDVPRASHLGYPSEKPGLPSSGWEAYYILTRGGGGVVPIYHELFFNQIEMLCVWLQLYTSKLGHFWDYMYNMDEGQGCKHVCK